MGIEDFNHKAEETVALNAHPGNAGKQAKVQEHGTSLASCSAAGRGQKCRCEEADVEKEDGTEEIHVDVDYVVPLILPGRGKKDLFSYHTIGQNSKVFL